MLLQTLATYIFSDENINFLNRISDLNNINTDNYTEILGSGPPSQTAD